MSRSTGGGGGAGPDDAATNNNEGDDYDAFNYSLGGSLMKDLLADLAVDEDDADNLLSLEQLEQELLNLENNNASSNIIGATNTENTVTTAAGMVVSSQAARAFAPPAATLPAEASAMDAWSLSLQKFTASSLEADFLQADSARKSQQQQASNNKPPGFQLDAAEEYDVTEPAQVMAAPPGITPDQSQQVISQAAAQLVHELRMPPQRVQEEVLLAQQLSQGLEQVSETQEVVPDKPPPPPPGSLSHVPKPPPMTPQNSMTYTTSSSSRHSSVGEAPTAPAPTPAATPVSPKPMNPVLMPGGGLQPLPPPMMPPPPQQQQHAPPPVMPLVAVPVQQPVAWQQQAHQPPPQPRRVVFANPHPSAPPIPATALQSRYMSARDISYVVHGMLRPILAAEQDATMSTYHLQYWTRHHPVKPPASNTKNNKKQQGYVDKLSKEMNSRAKVAKQWSTEHKTLGATTKTNVARPRALIAVENNNNSTSLNTGDDDTNNKQRAALWKSRIYCDQGYQALLLINNNKSSSSSSIMKVFKVLGITVQTVVTGDDDENDENKTVTNTYAVKDTKALQLLLKLSKGKVLLARIFEQALLPPAAVEQVLPVALDILCASAAPDNDDDNADDRVFAAAAVVIQTLPHLHGTAIVQMIRIIQRHASTTALSTTARMQCTHALLQRGGALASTDSEFATAQWNVVEHEFLKLLAGF